MLHAVGNRPDVNPQLVALPHVLSVSIAASQSLLHKIPSSTPYPTLSSVEKVRCRAEANPLAGAEAGARLVDHAEAGEHAILGADEGVLGFSGR